MLAYLIDTNVLSELTRQKPEPSVIQFVKEHPNLWLSVISFHEFSYGIARMNDPVRKAKLEIWLQNIKTKFAERTIPIDQSIASLAGELRANFISMGRACEPMDAIIGATALKNGLTLVTRNTKDFDQLGVELVNPWEG